MPILADALMDAGCDSDEIIQHCRQAGHHVRGCWVLELLLQSDSPTPTEGTPGGTDGEEELLRFALGEVAARPTPELSVMV
jgi:hypothetical protein